MQEKVNVDNTDRYIVDVDGASVPLFTKFSSIITKLKNHFFSSEGLTEKTTPENTDKIILNAGGTEAPNFTTILNFKNSLTNNFMQAGAIANETELNSALKGDFGVANLSVFGKPIIRLSANMATDDGSSYLQVAYCNDNSIIARKKEIDIWGDWVEITQFSSEIYSDVEYAEI